MSHKPAATVRMYRQGLGDCFLVRLAKDDGKPFHLLIDCGALNSKHYGADLMREVVEDIHEATGGRLDVVAVSHEHWDHISGFLQAKDLWTGKFKVDSVWTAWTEDTSRPEVAVLKKRFKKKKAAVAMAMARIPDALKDQRLGAYKRAIGDLFGFFGGLGAAGEGNTEKAWKIALGLAKNRYLDPHSQPLQIGGLPGVRVYVLGPPTDPEFVKKKVSVKETYDSASRGMTLIDSFHAALNEEYDPLAAARSKPFDAHFQIPVEEARTDAKWGFLGRYAFSETDPDYWRSIEHDWLTSAGELALHLDGYTNNTCLAFAIELGDEGPVLLFPGDAQVGNWLSWETLSWQVPDTANPSHTKKITSTDLLARTVFYKVGHHGSHNATMKGKGLEKMKSEELVAMIPVHRKTASDQEWEFPFVPLWARLKEKARGRVLLADASSLDEVENDLGVLSADERRRFAAATTHNRLYVEFRLETQS